MKKKIILTVIILIVLAAVVLIGLNVARGVRTETALPTVRLAKTNLVDSVLASGTVSSSQSKDVYSKLANYTVKNVMVKVGDRVKAGDVMAVLDTASLEDDIRQTELNINNASNTLDTETTNNANSVRTAENNLQLSEIELKTAQDNYDNTLALSKTGDSTSDELKQKTTALERAKLNTENARISLKNSKSKGTTTSRINIEIQKINLEKQVQTLKDATLTAPVDGTVTLVNAKAGESAAGLLFIVEDTDNLIVKTAIGEYDISLIKLGLPVSIKTDSTGDKQFTGTITKIAPTAMRDANGKISSSNVQFETEVAMTNADENVRIGLNVRLTIRLNEKKDVYAVPYEAVTTDTNGAKWVSVLESTTKNGKTVDSIRGIQVMTGMETDMEIEIQSDALKDGLAIITGTTEAANTARAGAAQ